MKKIIILLITLSVGILSSAFAETTEELNAQLQQKIELHSKLTEQLKQNPSDENIKNQLFQNINEMEELRIKAENKVINERSKEEEYYLNKYLEVKERKKQTPVNYNNCDAECTRKIDENNQKMGESAKIFLDWWNNRGKNNNSGNNNSGNGNNNSGEVILDEWIYKK